MIRDGRATVHSIISRRVTITGFDLTSHRQCLEKWNTAIATMYQVKKKISAVFCLKKSIKVNIERDFFFFIINSSFFFLFL